MAKAKSSAKSAPKKSTKKTEHSRKIQALSARITLLLFVCLIALTIGTLLYQKSLPASEAKKLQSSVITFSDLAEEDKKDSEFSAALQYLTSTKVMKGYDDGTFKPTQSVNRAEFLKMLTVSQGGAVVPLDEPCFKDTPMEAWFAPYVCFAKNAGWISGYKDGTAKPGNTIMISEALKILITAKQWNLDDAKSKKLPKGLDSKAWFAPYVKVALQKGLWKEKDFDPGKLLNRKEIALMLFRAILVDEMKVETYSTAQIADLFSNAGIALSTGPTTPPEPPAKAKK